MKINRLKLLRMAIDEKEHASGLFSHELPPATELHLIKTSFKGTHPNKVFKHPRTNHVFFYKTLLPVQQDEENRIPGVTSTSLHRHAANEKTMSKIGRSLGLDIPRVETHIQTPNSHSLISHYVPGIPLHNYNGDLKKLFKSIELDPLLKTGLMEYVYNAGDRHKLNYKLHVKNKNINLIPVDYGYSFIPGIEDVVYWDTPNPIYDNFFINPENYNIPVNKETIIKPFLDNWKNNEDLINTNIFPHHTKSNINEINRHLEKMKNSLEYLYNIPKLYVGHLTDFVDNKTIGGSVDKTVINPGWYKK